MTELLPGCKKKGLFRRQPEAPAKTRHFVIIRGEEVQSTKEKDGSFYDHSNPWWRIDGQETRETRRNHRDLVRRSDRVLEKSRGPVSHKTGRKPGGLAV
ncbi:hypothetical protein F5Y11DRAFT_317059 [Daldinia sp. FL1419]|nr:hypothetical protein F5Y11DRAFT_317059 [Daldinia sp. FL1419]